MCLSSQPQAYLQQAQDLVILESIILQTLGKLGKKNWVPKFAYRITHDFKSSANVFYFYPQKPHKQLEAPRSDTDCLPTVTLTIVFTFVFVMFKISLLCACVCVC